MRITSLDVTLNIIASGIMLAVAVLFVVVWKKKTGGLLRWVGIGCVAWIISVAIKVIIALLLSEHILNFLKDSLGRSGYVILGSFWTGLLTGITEIWIGYLIAKNRKYTSFNQGTGYGLAFGLTESALSVLVVVTLLFTEMFIPGKLPQEAVDVIKDMSWMTTISVNIERIVAFIIHITAGVLIVYCLFTKQIIYFWISFSYKSMVDTIAASHYYSGAIPNWNMWVRELFFIPFAIFGIWLIIKLRKRWPDSILETSTDSNDENNREQAAYL